MLCVKFMGATLLCSARTQCAAGICWYHWDDTGASGGGVSGWSSYISSSWCSNSGGCDAGSTTPLSRRLRTCGRVEVVPAKRHAVTFTDRDWMHHHSHSAMGSTTLLVHHGSTNTDCRCHMCIVFYLPGNVCERYRLYLGYCGHSKTRYHLDFTLLTVGLNTPLHK
jgi:hypothetical protein